MNTEQNNNQSFETILSTDERILCKRNHVRYHNYICGIVAGLLIWLYGFSCLEHGNLKNALTIGGLLLVTIFLLRIVLEKKVFIEKCNGARLTFKKKTYLLSDEKKLKKQLEESVESGYDLPTENPNGGVILEYARSAKGDVLYLRVVRWENLFYTTSIDTTRIEGEQAEHICQNLGL